MRAAVAVGAGAEKLGVSVEPGALGEGLGVGQDAESQACAAVQPL